MKKLIIALTVFSCLNTQAQKKTGSVSLEKLLNNSITGDSLSYELFKIYKRDGVYVIVIDFNTGRATEPKLYKKQQGEPSFTKNYFKPASSKEYYVANKKIIPKVGEKMQLVWINLPDSLKINSTVSFENKNIENTSLFNKFLSPTALAEKESSSGTGTQKKDTTKQIINNKEKEINNQSAEDAKKAEQKETENRSKTYITTVDKKGKSTKKQVNVKYEGKDFKINENNLVEALEVGEALSYLNKNKDQDSFKLKALHDIKVQQEFIKIAQQNLQYKINIRDTALSEKDFLINNLNKKIDSLASASSFIVDTIKKYIVSSALDFQVPNYDITQISYEVRKKDDNTLLDNREKAFLNKGGFKVDFSLGFVANKLVDDTYKVINPDLTTDTITRIVPLPKSQFGLGFGIFAHGYFRSGKRLNVAGSSGFAFNANNQILNFMAGISALFGMEQRIVVTAGIALGKVKELPLNVYRINENYNSKVLKNNADLSYVEKMKTKFFISVTYNISNLLQNKSSKIIAQ